MEIKITYLDNSGFLAESLNYNLIFDYYNTSPTREGKGIIDPCALARKTTLIFVSHSHYDHYTPEIWTLFKNVPNVEFIISDDIKAKASAVKVSPNNSYNIKGAEITTFKSTDEGVAFLIKADGVVIYHAGDLNWWDWEGEPKNWLADMERVFKEQILKLKGTHINIAFAPVDPRLERNMGKGARFLIDTADVDLLIPMHYGSAASAAGKFIAENFSNEEKTIVAPPLKRGESLIYTSEEKDGEYSFEVRRFVD